MPRLVMLLVLIGCTSRSDATRDRSERPSDRTTTTDVTVGVVAGDAPVVATGDGAAMAQGPAPLDHEVNAQVAADRTLTMTLPRPLSSKPTVTVWMPLPEGWALYPSDHRGEVTLRPVNATAKLPQMAVRVSAENLDPGTVAKTLQRTVITPMKTSVPEVQVRRVITDAHRDHRFVLSLEIESGRTEPRRELETLCLVYVESGGFAVKLQGTAAMDDEKVLAVFEAACASLVVPAPAEQR